MLHKDNGLAALATLYESPLINAKTEYYYYFQSPSAERVSTIAIKVAERNKANDVALYNNDVLLQPKIAALGDITQVLYRKDAVCDWETISDPCIVKEISQEIQNKNDVELYHKACVKPTTTHKDIEDHELVRLMLQVNTNVCVRS